MKPFFIFIFLAGFYVLGAQTFSLNVVVPAASHNILLAKHTFYEIGYNTSYRLPAWTYYSLTREHLKNANLERKGAFKKDPLLNSVQANDKDYVSTGLDKGHMVPCEDMSFSETAMAETFYYSNCVPQTTELNRGEWKSLEELCRSWAIEYGDIKIISGPVLENDLSSIGKQKIPLPKTCYKIILRPVEQSYKAIAFLLPNHTTTLSALPDYICSIDSVEKLTGLDFFADLPDHMETQFESASHKTDWSFDHHRHHSKDSNESTPKLEAIQCKAITKKGARCKKTANSSDGYCSQHHK